MRSGHIAFKSLMASEKNYLKFFFNRVKDKSVKIFNIIRKSFPLDKEYFHLSTIVETL